MSFFIICAVFGRAIARTSSVTLKNYRSLHLFLIILIHHIYINIIYIYIKTSTIEYSHCLTRLLILALQTILKKINATKFIITISIYFTTHISCYVTLSLISFTVGSLSRHDNNRFNLFYE